MTKRILLLLLAVLLCAGALTACGEEKTVTDPAALAEALAAADIYSTDLYPVDASLVGSVLAVTAPYTSAYVYATAGDAADEIAVLTAADETAAKAIYDQLTAHRTAFSQLYSTYAPDQCPRIDGGLLVQIGTAVVWCVSNDTDAAHAILESHTK